MSKTSKRGGSSRAMAQPKIRLAYVVKTKNKSSASPGDYAITGNTTQEMGKVTTYRWLRVLEEGII